MKIPVVLSWSGGKDSAMALHELSRHADYEVVGLLTTVSDEYKRISHHGVREELLDLQAAAIGLALDKIYLPSSNSHPCTNAVYEQIMSEAMQRYLRKGVATVGFGDLFLENLRAWRERNLATIGMQALFPLWKRPTRELVREIIALGFKGYLSCVEGKVGPGFAGRSLDESLLTDLPSTVDPCGETGWPDRTARRTLLRRSIARPYSATVYNNCIRNPAGAITTQQQQLSLLRSHRLSEALMAKEQPPFTVSLKVIRTDIHALSTGLDSLVLCHVMILGYRGANRIMYRRFNDLGHPNL